MLNENPSSVTVAADLRKLLTNCLQDGCEVVGHSSEYTGNSLKLASLDVNAFLVDFSLGHRDRSRKDGARNAGNGESRDKELAEEHF